MARDIMVHRAVTCTEEDKQVLQGAASAPCSFCTRATCTDPQGRVAIKGSTCITKCEQVRAEQPIDIEKSKQLRMGNITYTVRRGNPIRTCHTACSHHWGARASHNLHPWGVAGGERETRMTATR